MDRAIFTGGTILFFFRTGGQARRDHIYQEFERGGLKGPGAKANQGHLYSWGSSTIHRSPSGRSLHQFFLEWGVSKLNLLQGTKQKIQWFWGELNSLKWAVIKTLGWLGYIGYIILPRYIGITIRHLQGSLFKSLDSGRTFQFLARRELQNGWAFGDGARQKVVPKLRRFETCSKHSTGEGYIWFLISIFEDCQIFWEHLHVKHVTLTPFCFF